MIDSRYDDTNIFAKILKGEARADIVYENENVLCFNDIYPKAPVHVLVIPKRKFIDLSDFSENSKSEEKIDIFDAFSALVKKFGLEKNGYRLISNSGSFGRQEVPHLHFHILGGKDIGKMISN